MVQRDGGDDDRVVLERAVETQPVRGEGLLVVEVQRRATERAGEQNITSHFAQQNTLVFRHSIDLDDIGHAVAPTVVYLNVHTIHHPALITERQLAPRRKRRGLPEGEGRAVEGVSDGMGGVHRVVGGDVSGEGAKERGGEERTHVQREGHTRGGDHVLSM